MFTLNKLYSPLCVFKFLSNIYLFIPVFRIHTILIWIRIRIRGSVSVIMDPDPDPDTEVTFDSVNRIFPINSLLPLSNPKVKNVVINLLCKH